MNIDRIMTSFPFEEVQRYMKSTGWEWAGIVGTPSIAQLRSTAADVLRLSANSPLPCTESGTGGFWASKFTWGDGSQQLSLSFQPWRHDVTTKDGSHV